MVGDGDDGNMLVVEDGEDDIPFLMIRSKVCIPIGYNLNAAIATYALVQYIMYKFLYMMWQIYEKYGSPAKVCGLRINLCKSKQEEFLVNDTSELCPELFDFCIERFCSGIS